MRPSHFMLCLIAVAYSSINEHAQSYIIENYDKQCIVINSNRMALVLKFLGQYTEHEIAPRRNEYCSQSLDIFYSFQPTRHK